ncbi:hypothetical protein AJ79_05910 [Helicocarpus griseus UAMH5409]|uniref:Carboxypeptidase n=1 Tax=Helicocarpus griseus UAMH5409 TaxID=1447875 RepID=A0A2B7XIH4_9EURO|nr:hypothetical protein AJ79_05910 [Helicocarpus griseus UAMH5409]
MVRVRWRLLPLLALFLFTVLSYSSAQFPPIANNDPDIKTIRSPINDNITISYKSPPLWACNTSSPYQKQYSGYVHLSPSTISPVQQEYPINAFFWFIEARENVDSAPLTIYLNGGPGSSSLVGLFQEVGPCEAIELSRNQMGTRAREWGWDRASNLLFIDQPVQAGFSYDSLRNGSLDLVSSSYTFPPAPVPSGYAESAFLNGTFSSNNPEKTTKTTATAAKAFWHTLQGFLGVFPQYHPGSAGFHLFTESYGGKYGPAFATHFEKQNEALRNGDIPKETSIEINLKSLGILQGCIDDLIQDPFYPIFAHNNTYGIQAISHEEMESSLAAFHKPGGCKEQITLCRSAASSLDPAGNGDVDRVNALCFSAMYTCRNDMVNPFYKSNRGGFDISQSPLSAFAPLTHLTYLNTASVQTALGISLNYTDDSEIVQSAFISTGDYMRTAYVPQLASLLVSGIRVALIYGDRDYVCNWMGGEAVSLAIASSPNSPAVYRDRNAFRDIAGYEPLTLTSMTSEGTHTAGVVRQLGNLSFARVYDAGHFVPAAQPEAAFALFSRIISGEKDIASGKDVDLSSFHTTGPANSTKTNIPPTMAETKCYVRAAEDTCSEEKKRMLKEGCGVIINGVLYRNESEWEGPDDRIDVKATGKKHGLGVGVQVVLDKVRAWFGRL